MSQTSLPPSSSPPPSFHTIFDDALKRYREKTKNNLFSHPLTAALQNCKLPSDFLAILYEKHNVQGFIQSQNGNQTREQWLNATFTVLGSFSATIGGVVGLVNLPKADS
jgi:hypothetical protein